MAESIAFGLENFDTNAVMPLVLPERFLNPSNRITDVD